MIEGYDSPIIPILWYYPDGSQCPTEHEVISVRDDDGDITGLQCKVTGQPIHSVVVEVKRLCRQLDLTEDVARKMKQHLMNRIDRIKAAFPTHVYIAESIFSGESAWKGRTVFGVCLSLKDALDSLSIFAAEGEPLIATQRDEDAEDPDRWMVHRPDEAALWDGALWVHRYPIYKKEEGV